MKNVRFSWVSGAVLLAFAAGCSSDSGGDDGGNNEPKKPGALVINEVYAKNQKDWVELYNGTDADIDLNGYRILDDRSRMIIPEGTMIASGGFLVFFRTELPADNTFSLNESFDEVRLYDRNDIEVDYISWSEPLGTFSYARTEDGGGTFQIAEVPSPGEPNVVTVPSEPDPPEEEDPVDAVAP